LLNAFPIYSTGMCVTQLDVVEEGGGNQRMSNTEFNNKINKYKTKVNDCHVLKHKTQHKSRPVPLLIFTVVAPNQYIRISAVKSINLDEMSND